MRDIITYILSPVIVLGVCVLLIRFKIEEIYYGE